MTARGETPAEFKANLEAIRGLLDSPPAPQSPPPASPQGQGTQGPGWCAVHDVAMKCNVRDGHSWFSHRLPEGGWCKGRKVTTHRATPGPPSPRGIWGTEEKEITMLLYTYTAIAAPSQRPSRP